MQLADSQTCMEKRSPDIAQCRASLLGAGHLVFCQSQHRVACGYALPYGIKHFCMHPQCLEIADRTARQQTPDHRSDEPPG